MRKGKESSRLRRTHSTAIGAVVVAAILILAAPMLLQSVFGDEFGSYYVNISHNFPASGSPAIASVGNYVYVAYVEDSGLPGTDIRFSYSSDGGRTYSNSVNLSNLPTNSQSPQIAASGNYVHVTWIEVNGPLTTQYYARSSDNGQNFGIPTQPFAFTNTKDLTTSIASSGSNVYILYLHDPDTAPMTLTFLRSTNNGDSFSARNLTATEPVFEDSVTLEKNEPKVAASGSNVYLTWIGHANFATNEDVMFLKSSDDGASFVEHTSIGGLLTTKFGQSNPSSALVAAFGNTISKANSGTALGKYVVTFEGTTDIDTFVAPNVVNFPTPPDAGLGIEFGTGATVVKTGPTSFDMKLEIYFNVTGSVSDLSLGNATTELFFFPDATLTSLTQTGSPTIESVQDLSPSDLDEEDSDVAASTGGVYVTWSRPGIQLSRSIDGGINFLPPALVISDAGEPSIAAVDSDVVIAGDIPTPEFPPGIEQVLYASSEDNGASFGPEQELANNPFNDSHLPDLSANSAEIFATWGEMGDVFVATTEQFVTLDLSSSSVKWGSHVALSGFANAQPGDTISVHTPSGPIMTGIPINAGSSWGPVDYVFDTPGDITVTVDLVEIGLNVVGTTQAIVTVNQHETEFLMNDIGNPAADTPLTVSGILIDKDSGLQLPSGQLVSFTGAGAAGLSTVATGGIVVNDPDGVVMEHCATCIPDPENASGNMLMRLHPTGQLQFPAGTQSVEVSIQDIGIQQAFFTVKEFGNPATFGVSTFGDAPNEVNLMVSAPNGIEFMTLDSITGSVTTLGVSRIQTSNPENSPQEMITADFENEEEGTYPILREFESGSFFVRATAVDSPSLGRDVQAHYLGDGNLFSGTDSVQQLYDIIARTWGAAGDPTSFNVDTGTGINTIKCATDADGDGLCSNWDVTSPGQGISYAGVTYDLCDFECPAGEGKKDVYVEIDSYANHVPPLAAITNVKNAFDNGPGDIALHVHLDDTMSHAHNLIKVWADTTTGQNNVQDDFEDIKANNFGTSGERTGALLANSNLLKAKAQVYHYGISVHGIGTACDASTPSGIGEAPGNDFVISLGCGFHDTGAHTGSEGDQNEFEGTLMHELGHNLNLDHGGPKEYRVLPNGNSLSGSQAYAVADAGGNDATRSFTVSGLSVVTNQGRTGTAVIPVNLPFSTNPGTTTVSSITKSGDGSGIVVNTVTAFVSGTGNSRLVTLKVNWDAAAAATTTTGDLGSFTVNLNVATTGATLNAPTTPAAGAKLKINISGNDSGMNCKVNYQSVMSYTRQFDTYLGAFYVLDFSRDNILPTINEASSNGESGFFTGGGTAGSKVVNAYTSGGSRAYKVSTYPNVDWSGDGNIAGAAIQDSNHFGIAGCGASANQNQKGFDDWENIQLDFKEGIGSFDGIYSDPRQQLEITGEIVAEAVAQVEQNTAITSADPPGGAFGAPVAVAIQSTDPMATIYYTTNGDDPTDSSASEVGQVELLLSSDTVVKFFSISGGNPEPIKTETYTVEAVIDTTPPEIIFVGDIADGDYFASGTVPAEPTCTATDPESGILEPPGCEVSGYSAADGAHTLIATAANNAGLEATLEITYYVGPLTFQGFYSPVDNQHVVNTVKSGKTVPLKFEVFAGGTEVTNVSVITGVKQFKKSCDPQAVTDPVEETVSSPGGTQLRYDEPNGQFVFNWKAPNAKGCYDVVVTLDSGSTLTAKFKVT